ncbi:hypothetical protein B0H14DRAFT_3501456 [Mycena olivaceomarginata]|nr:hypothetical protein B0H14DRAFT_3501456 [Mycena olivaceomarginata]
MQAHPVPTPASTTSDSPSHHLLELAHGTPIPRSDDAQRHNASVPQSVRSYPRARVRHPDPRGRRSRSPCVPTLKLAHGTPIPLLDDTRRGRRRACSSHAPTLKLARGTPIPRSDDTWQHGHRSRSPCVPTLELQRRRRSCSPRAPT